MDDRGIRALALARAVGFDICTTRELAVVSVEGDKLKVGPLASPDQIATIAMRKMLRLEGCFDELALANAVEERGYAYRPEPWRVARC